jgi:hypothetical protein
VTLTINEGVKTSYADVLATARQKVPLAEISVESLGMRKSMTGGIIIRLPGTKTEERRPDWRRVWPRCWTRLRRE